MIKRITMKKQIQITESQINNAVKAVLNEWYSETQGRENDSAYKELIDISIKLDMIMNSGFIPFASPSPSSTELELANAVIQAQGLINKAAELCKNLGYSE